MTPLDDRLRTGLSTLVDGVVPHRTPDQVLEELRSRPPLVDATPPPTSRRRVLLLAAAACVALALVAGALVVAFDRSPDPTRVDVTPTPTAPATWDLESLGAGWHDLPPSPLGPYSGALVWTGEQLISWRGEGFAGGGFGAGDGWTTESAAFDMASGEWTVLPPDPYGDAVVTAVGGVWTGDEAVFWSEAGLVVWSPAAGTWRTGTAPPEPITDGVWTGSEIVFWNDGLSYDPAADTWSSIPSPPVSISVARPSSVAVWTGTEIVVATGTEGLSYSPEARSWTALPAIPADELVHDGTGWDTYMAGAVLVGDEVWVITGTGGPAAPGFAFDLDDRTWRRLTPEERPPLASSEGPPVLATVDEILYAANAGGLETVRAGSGPWSAPVVSGRTQVVAGRSVLFAAYPIFAVYVPPDAGVAGGEASIEDARLPAADRTVVLPLSAELDGLGGSFVAGASPSAPSALAIDDDGRLHVVDWVRSRVAIFDRDGVYEGAVPAPSVPADVARLATGETLLGLIGSDQAVVSVGPGADPPSDVVDVPVVRMATTGGAAWVETGVGVWQRVDGQGGHEVLLGDLPISLGGAATSLSMAQTGSVARLELGSDGAQGAVEVEVDAFSAGSPLMAEALDDGGWLVAFPVWRGEMSRLVVLVIDEENRVDEVLQLPTPSPLLEAGYSGVRWDPSTDQIAVVTDISRSAVQIEWFDVR